MFNLLQDEKPIVWIVENCGNHHNSAQYVESCGFLQIDEACAFVAG